MVMVPTDEFCYNEPGNAAGDGYIATDVHCIGTGSDCGSAAGKAITGTTYRHIPSADDDISAGGSTPTDSRALSATTTVASGNHCTAANRQLASGIITARDNTGGA